MDPNAFSQRVLEPQDLNSLLNESTNSSELFLPIFVGSAESFTRAHVPNSALISPAQLVCGTAPAPGKVADEVELQHLFESLGISKETTIVAYDDEGGGWAGRLIWTLDIIGHNNYLFLNGGINAWFAEGLAVEQGYQPNTSVEASSYPIKFDPNQIVTVAKILQGLADDSVQIWDARSAQEHSGEKVVAARGGRIPSAKNIDWLELMDRNNSLKLKPIGDIEQLLEQRGLKLDNQKTTITHCQSHHRSGLSYLVGKLLGLHIMGYDGSWSEWGNLIDTPIESDV